MKKHFFLLLVATMLLCILSSTMSSVAFANCSHQWKPVTEWVYDNSPLFFEHYKTPIYRYSQCSLCGEWSDNYYEVRGDTLKEDHSMRKVEKKTVGKDGTYHWDIIETYDQCTKCNHIANRQTTTANQKVHYASNPTSYIDGGCSNGKHKYYQYCSLSGCSRYFLWRTITCPGNGNHLGPVSVAPPTLTE